MSRNLTKALNTIKEFEGLRLKAYKDPVGIPTIGWGTIVYPNGKKVQMGDIISEAQANEYLMHEVKQKTSGLDSYIKVDVNDNEYCALVSFAYNVGLGAFKSSTLLRLLNEGKPRAIVADQFDRWNKAGGEVLNGLIRRRAAEKKLFLTPIETKEVVEKAGAEIEIPAWFEPFKKWIELIIDKLFGVIVTPAPDSPSEIDQILTNIPEINKSMVSLALRKRKDNIKYFSKNLKYMTLVDFSLPDWEDRMFVIDMDTYQLVAKSIAAHGAKSDQNRDNYADTFSNKSGSNCSSLGLKRFAENYVSSKKKSNSFRISRRIDGLEPELNGNERARACVLHDSSGYVNLERKAAKNVGDSLGCLVPLYEVLKKVNPLLENSMLYCWHTRLGD